ncbi:MAG: serpin family protein [Microscillaceae bacterium]|jgi:serpin B|nr:serpin family protein [Microscillaceae bacterium]
MKGNLLTLFSLLIGSLPIFAQNTGGSKSSPPAQVNESIKALASANNQFADKFYQKLLKSSPKDNLFFSPLSLHTAFMMLYSGSTDATQTELQNLFGFKSNNTYLPDYQQFNRFITSGRSDNREIAMANSIWLSRDFAVKTDYLQNLQKYFQSTPTTVDFGQAATVRQINDWVSENTKGKIPQLVSQLSPDMQMALLNAIYFKDTWKNEFNPGQTHDEYFKVSEGEGEPEIVKFMQQKGEFRYWENPQLQILEMPYKDEKFSMVVLLPSSGEMKNLESQLSDNQLNTWISQLTPQLIDAVKIPRFKFETDIPAKDILIAMGARSMFLGGLGKIADGKLLISEVKHKAVIEVSEKGTEAAAVTMISVERSMHKIEHFNKTFVADRPFIFLIRENKSNAILFMGKVMNPNQ